MKTLVYCARCSNGSPTQDITLGDPVKLPQGWIEAIKPMDPPGMGTLRLVICDYCRSKLTEWWKDVR